MIRSLQNIINQNILKFMLRKSFVLVVFLLTGTFNQLYASHMMGADISYVCLGSNKYRFTAKIYRDCRGIPFNNPTVNAKCVQGGSQTSNISYSRTSIRDITPTCVGGGKLCNPENQTITASSPAIEEHTYSFDFDFSTWKANGCCKVQIGVGQCCRNGAITTGGSGNDFWTYCEIDLCIKKCNNSPSLTSEPVAILCCNQPYYYNNGASDTADHDSLSYVWADPMTSWTGKTSWSGARNSQSPFADYWPSGYDKNKGPNPNTNPPIGTYLDPETGDIIFTPTDCSEVTIASIKVTEWRKDSTKNYQKIGETRRDIQFITITCPDNNPPILNGPYKYETCAGTEICFTITSDDKQFIPPPPQKPNPPDTVNLTWNRGIPGGTFTIIDPKARLKKAKFCWTPKKDNASDIPYTFTVTARDNSCPRNAITVKSYSVKVKQIAETKRTYTKLICGAYAVKSEVLPNFKGTPDYLWEVSDSANKLLDSRYFNFKPSKALVSKKAVDTIQFRKGGKYIIHHRINNPPLNCPSDYFDTLVVPPLLEVDLALGPDTFVCAGTTLRLGAKTVNGVPKFKYKWLTPKDSDPKDTLTYLDVYMSTHDTTFRVEITDDNKCVAFDTINIFLKPNPKVDMGPDLRICWYGSVTVKPDASNAYWVDPEDGDTLQQGDTLWWTWKRNGTTFSTKNEETFNEETIYTVTVRDSLGCNWTDTMRLHVNDTIRPNAGPDQVKCFDDLLTLTAGGLDSTKKYQSGSYNWWKGVTEVGPPFSKLRKPAFKVQNSSDYLLKVIIKEDTTVCFNYDTVFVKVNPLPVLTLTTPQKFCCDYGTIAMGSAAFGSPTGGIWSCREKPAYVKSNVFDTPNACDPVKPGVFTLIYTYQDPVTTCINKDSTQFTINPLPALQLKGGYYCQDIIEAPLKKHIVAPVNLNSMVDVKWRLIQSLKKPNGTINTSADLIYDKDPSLNYDWWIKVDSASIDIGSAAKDSLIIEITIQDGQGCFNKDTMVVFVWKVPVIKFNIFPDLCIDKGLVSLDKLSNVTPDDGCWKVINAPGFKDTSFLKPGMVGCDSLNTLSLNLQNGPGLYKLRYIHTASGCPVQRDTNLRINPLPNVNISISPKGDNGKFCQIDPDVTLEASPAGGVWSSSVAGTIGGGYFMPKSVPASERDKWITLTYRYTHPTTKCDTMKSLQVFVQSKPVVDIITPDLDTCRTNLMNIKLTADYSFTKKITWYHDNDVLKTSFESGNQASNLNPTTLTTKPRSDSATYIFITCQTEAEGVCPFAQDFMSIAIHPVPHAIVTIDDPDGCVPHTANFTTRILNEVDSARSQYLWGFSFNDVPPITTQNASKTYTVPKLYRDSILITSEWGCDTMINPTSISVYPAPVASFTPNPNNRTTAALPRFKFTNESTTKQLILGSKLVKYVWDFGQDNVNNDTSGETHPEYYYTSDTGKYYVKLKVVTNHGCVDSTNRLVIIDPDILVFIPNVFTPDGAGPFRNDKFWVEASGYITYQILIFNRWGEKLYESDRLDRPWDGTSSGGVPCQMDAYVYQVNVTSFSGELYKYNGTVILVR